MKTEMNRHQELHFKSSKHPFQFMFQVEIVSCLNMMVFEGVNANYAWEKETSYFSCFPVHMDLQEYPEVHMLLETYGKLEYRFSCYFLPSDDDRCSIVVIRPLYV